MFIRRFIALSNVEYLLGNSSNFHVKLPSPIFLYNFWILVVEGINVLSIHPKLDVTAPN